jgi:hypothetical protein
MAFKSFKPFKTSIPSGQATNEDREWRIEDRVSQLRFSRTFAPFALPFLKDFAARANSPVVCI